MIANALRSILAREEWIWKKTIVSDAADLQCVRASVDTVSTDAQPRSAVP